MCLLHVCAYSRRASLLRERPRYRKMRDMHHPDYICWLSLRKTPAAHLTRAMPGGILATSSIHRIFKERP